MAAADPVFSQTEVKSFALAGEARTGIKRWFGVMSAPQWAMAATAVLVIAISLPLLLQSGRRDSSNLQGTATQPEQAKASGEPQRAFDPQECACARQCRRQHALLKPDSSRAATLKRKLKESKKARIRIY